jgi:hypothetical protein
MANTGLFVVPYPVVQTAVSTAGAADTSTPASNSVLIAFLPLIGTVIGAIFALIGAFLGARWNSRYRNREAEQARKEEREGLLILLSMEVNTNNRSLETFLKGLAAKPDFDSRAGIAATLHSAVWDESKVRLAQLIPGTYLGRVASYYKRIDLVRLSWTSSRGKLSERDEEQARDIKENGITVIREAQDYISDPGFSGPLLKDEDIV